MGDCPINLYFAPMGFDDLEDVIDIEKRSFSNPWTADMFVFEMSQIKVSYHYVARKDNSEGQIVGYICFWLFDDADEAQITNVAVEPELRNLGIGREILRFVVGMAIEKKISEMFLEVRVSNMSARHLYESEGFIEIGRRKKYYSDTGEDAIVMKKLLYIR